MAGCLIVFSGVVLYKVTYHLDKHGKDEEETERTVRYRQVNGSQTEIEEDAELWLETVPPEMLHNGDSKKAYEMEAVDIQMGLVAVEFQETKEVEDGEDGDLGDDSESSMRHRIT